MEHGDSEIEVEAVSHLGNCRSSQYRFQGKEMTYVTRATRSQSFSGCNKKTATDVRPERNDLGGRLSVGEGELGGAYPTYVHLARRE